MKGLLLFFGGVAAGFLIAHTVSRTPQGEQFFAEVDARTREFGAAVVDGYKAREAELHAAVSDTTASGVDDTISDFTRTR